ncbi:MAG: BspA family leucine-rich repeat surface protein [Bacilli bacterium]|nr:BspA family leucine-rich repeat surface protein [Bacilli bacterium]
MKKIVLFLLLLFFPLFVFAKDTCDPGNIKIESITLEDTKGNIEEVKKASSSGQKINLGLRMNVVGDTASYKIVLKNTSNEDYYFDEKSLNLDTDYVDYTVSYEDDNNLMKGGEEKILFLKVVYKEKMDSSTLENGLYQDTQVVKLNLTNNNLVDEILENPVTGRKLGLLIFIVLIVGCVLFHKEKKKSAYLFLIVGLTLPFSVRALCRHSLEIENDLIIDTKEAIFLPGEEVNVKMKRLAGTTISNSTYPFTAHDNNILSIQYSEVEPESINKEEKNIVSTSESSYLIYMWYDNGTIYWWSEDKSPALNSDASKMFYSLESLTNINGIKLFDTSMAQSLELLFYYATSLTNIDAVSNWNLLNVETIRGIFINTKISDLSPVSLWNISNVKIIRSAFQGIETIKNINSLKNWNIENVEDMSYLFNNCKKLEDISILSFWKTKNVNNFSYVFSNTSISDLSSLKNWNVSKATTLRGMFMFCTYIVDASVINEWDVTSASDFTYMFAGVPVLPEFSKVNGTWSNGTFTPSS